MKKTNILLLPVLAAIVAACYKDISTEAGYTIPDIVIENLKDTIFVSFGDNLSLSPEVSQEGRSEEDFSYLWEMDIDAGRPSTRIEISDAKDLELKIANTPNSAPYVLSFTVTDKQSGISAIHPVYLYVSNSLGEGLLVAYTRDGGKTSDMDLVSSPSVTYGFEGEEPEYVRGLYSLVNDAPLDGRIQAMNPTYASINGSFDQSRLMVGTESHLYYLDPLTYTISGSDGELLNMPAENYNTTALFNLAEYSTGAIIGGQIYGYVTYIPTAYGIISYSGSDNDVFSPANTSYNLQNEGRIMLFSSHTGNFYYVSGWTVSTGGSFTALAGTFPFDLTGAESIAAGGMTENFNGFVIRTTDSKYYLFMVKPSGNSSEIRYYEIKEPEIENAVTFTFCDNTNIFYFATPDKVYSNYVSGNTLVSREVSWSPDSGSEKITGVKHYKQAWYGTHRYGETGYEFALPTNRAQIIITTYNESTGEGKIYLRAFNVSTGLFTMTGDNGTFDGFGEITAIAPTFR